MSDYDPDERFALNIDPDEALEIILEGDGEEVELDECEDEE
jgi:hypothetical protein